MKKFLSMVMAAAMVVSLVPATAFAATGDFKATAKVIDAQNFPVDGVPAKVGGSELQLTLTTGDSLRTQDKMKFTVTLDNVKDLETVTQIEANDIFVLDEDGKVTKDYTVKDFDVTDEDEFEFVVEEKDDAESGEAQFKRGIVIGIDLSGVQMDKVSKGKTATITIDSDDATITNGDDLVFASVEAEGIKVSVKDTVDVATEEVAELKEIKIEPAVGDTFATMKGSDEIKLKLNSGFEFVVDGDTYVEGDNGTGKYNLSALQGYEYDDDEIVFEMGAYTGASVIKITGLQVEATSAKAGSTATVRVYATGNDTVSVEVAKVVDYTVSMTVDEDDDVPVIYSGVNVDNKGITDDSDHESLEVTIEESFAGAWNNSKDFTLSVPEGVYITDVVNATLEESDLVDAANEKAWFEAAYEEGDYVDLTFKRRGWTETDPNGNGGASKDPAKLTFTLELVADPNFEGDVVLKLTGDAVDEQEVTIAKFVKPYVVEAQQNDMQIDYRNTEIPTSVVVKEAEAGLWEKDTKFVLTLDKINFDDEGTIAVDDKSGLEIKDDEVKLDSKNYENDAIYFTVDSRSDDEPAVVTISGLQLYMDRSLPAGAYDLDLNVEGMNDLYEKQVVLNGANDKVENDDRRVEDINDDFVSYTAKAGFVNIVTAGREDTDSFTTKVVVPVGESYLISGENKVEIPVPAYINAAGYTMLPLRAVAVALGINENNVLWDQTTRTATVMYGSKIINMTYGQKVVYVNGAMIPATAAVEITNDRMFLGLRDLGNALGVTDITWDAATKTATLNGNK
ncbi:copper amine oxidase N-terminal domain-containing protein [Anaerotignum lactatifermentans]|uniref:Copper amine oxidase N-terminal domain-containing protein n=1 Tax=Anaerotignum lactatifermentans DSM 14214 TaxID=1121323 RepID=A0A1M6XAE3_9FIRM|nr:copper amine oxidase N-terminal domain-containing protein [Anaerotignum lactatifermentans]SHL02924.1 Copper amine oxidase N-terminal domain-containing protein [[Clostridium] lactatifermentans DSM 14214] [Anaerotignum lactatifermentans DSM 14214]